MSQFRDLTIWIFFPLDSLSSMSTWELFSECFGIDLSVR